MERCPSWSKEHDWKSCKPLKRLLGFESPSLRHVGAKLVLLRFSLQEKHPPASLLLLFRKKSRSAYLFGCKRPHDGSLSLPTFCELRGFNSHLRKAGKIFFMCLSHVAADGISFAATFLQKSLLTHSVAAPFRIEPAVAGLRFGFLF